MKRKNNLSYGEAITLGELNLWINNTGSIYNRKRDVANLFKKKMNKGIFNVNKASILTKRAIVDVGAKDYEREFMNRNDAKNVFTSNIKRASAKSQTRDILRRIKEGEF